MLDSPVFVLALRYLSFREQGSDGRFRFSLASNKQTLSSILGLALGVGVLLIVLSIVNGFEREMRERVLSVLPHAVLFNESGLGEQGWDGFIQELEQADTENSVIAAAPLESFQALLIGEDELAPVQVKGVNPELEKHVSLSPQLLIEGQWSALEEERYSIVLGYRLASRLNVANGDTVKLMLPEARYSLLGATPRYRQFTVVGLLKVGSVLDEHLAYVPIEAAHKLLRKREGVTQVRLKMTSLFDAAWDAWEVVGKLNEDAYAGDAEENDLWYAQDWTQTQGSLYQIITMTKSMLGLLVLLIVLVASFNLSSTLIMLVHEKRSDIAILLSQGLKPRQVQWVFVLQALLIACSGLLLGLGLAILFLSQLQGAVQGLENLLQMDLTSAYPVHYLPSEILFADVVLISVAVFLLSVLASVYPARLASKVNPAEELSYE